MNEYCLLKGFPAGPSEAFDRVKPINEEVISEGTQTHRVVWQFYSQFFKESPHCSP